MKKILIVEDDGRIYNMIKAELDPSSFEIVRARAVDVAIGAVEEDGPFDCFVIDLNILGTGLTLEEMANYKRREGYAFLKNHLWSGKLKNYLWQENEKEKKVEELKSKTIICSRYVDKFEDELLNDFNKEQLIKKDKEFERKVAKLVNKYCM